MLSPVAPDSSSDDEDAGQAVTWDPQASETAHANRNTWDIYASSTKFGDASEEGASVFRVHKHRVPGRGKTRLLLARQELDLDPITCHITYVTHVTSWFPHLTTHQRDNNDMQQ